MTIKLKGLANYKEKQLAFANVIQNGGTKEEQNEAFAEMMNSLSEDLTIEAKKQARSEAEEFINANYGNNKMSPDEVKFFNDIKTDVGYKEEKLLPQTTIDEIFEDLTTEHPLLAAIGLKSAGIRLKFLKSETSGVAVWGKVFGEIKGQLDAAFSEEETISNKLTAFVVIPKDLQELGVGWIKRFVVAQITEAFAMAMEAAFVSGDGNDKPVGLNRDVHEGVSISGGVYPEKKPSGTLTFGDPKATVKELVAMYKYHSLKENGQALNVSGMVNLLVNPENAWDVRTQYTHLNSNGVYVTALPFNLNIIESIFVKKDSATSFVTSRYDAYVGGGVGIKLFDQTFALEDLDLYAAKQFVFGKAKDDKAAAVWNLKIVETPEVPEEKK